MDGILPASALTPFCIKDLNVLCANGRLISGSLLQHAGRDGNTKRMTPAQPKNYFIERKKQS